MQIRRFIAGKTAAILTAGAVMVPGISTGTNLSNGKAVAVPGGAVNSYEKAVCAAAGAWNCYMAYASANAANEDTNNRYPAPRYDGTQQNAFRHSSWNARMSVVLGSRGLADDFATAHEKPISSGNPPGTNQSRRHERMDLCNNHRGRDRPSNVQIVALDQMTAVNKLYNDSKYVFGSNNTCNGDRLVVVRKTNGTWYK